LGKIIQLADELSNKIAAGEVVERPASVVKELVENSIDANSTWIKIELVEAGLKLIKITDDGDGIEEDDSVIAFERHATSKIVDEHDLFRVKTLGFRGEALASIASVSHLTLKTSTGEKAGTELTIIGGEIKGKNKSDKRKGTEITVEHLFFNTPARLKYLKTVHTELGHITDVIQNMALSHPNIRFECEHNNKRIFFTNGNGDLRQVVQQIYGYQVARNMFEINNESLDYDITGLISKPELTRSARKYMTLIVNGRYIKNPYINKAILEGYHTFLPIGRFPLVILKIEMDPYLVDVNVHPAKTEVRFSKERELFDIVKNTINERLKKERLIPSGVKKEKTKSEQTSLTFNDVNKDEYEGNHLKEEEQPLNYQFGHMKPSIDDVNDVPIPSIDEAIDHFENQEENIRATSSHPNKIDRMPDMYPIGQLHGTYILAQNEQGMYMIDQHAAQERIKYEYYKKQLGKPAEQLQELAIPLTFEFTNQEAMVIEENREFFENVGLFLEPFGNHSYIIRSHPSWFPKGEEEEVIRDMIDELIDHRMIDLEKIREEAAILMACKRSIKANHYLNRAEMEYLLNDLRQCDSPFTCPHGRPVIIHFSDYEIKRMFKRIM